MKTYILLFSLVLVSASCLYAQFGGGDGDGYGSATISNSFLGEIDCAADVYEPNDSLPDAKYLLAGSILSSKSNYICPPGDEDWFYLPMKANRKLVISLKNLPANYQLELYGPSQALIASSLNAGNANEGIVQMISSGGNYYVRVYGNERADWSGNQAYTLDFSTTTPVPSYVLTGIKPDPWLPIVRQMNPQTFASYHMEEKLIYISPGRISQKSSLLLIRDVSGKEVYRRTFMDPYGEHKISVDAAQFPPGIYVIRLESVDNVMTGKVVIFELR